MKIDREEFARLERNRRREKRERMIRLIHEAEKKYGDLRKAPENATEVQLIEWFVQSNISNPHNGEELYKKQNLDPIYVRLIDDMIIKKYRAGYEKARIAKMLNISSVWVKETLKKAGEDHPGYFYWLAKNEKQIIYSTSLDALKKYFEYYHHGDLMRESDQNYKWLPKGWQLERGKYYYWQLPVGAEYIKNGKINRKD